MFSQWWSSQKTEYKQFALVLHPTYRVQHVMETNKITGIVGIVNSDICFSVIQGLISVLVFGILFYPYFACLTTKYKLIGSLMGFLYAAIRYEAVIILLFTNQWVGLLTCMAGDKLHSFCNSVAKSYSRLSWISIVANICSTYSIPKQMLR